MRRCICANWPTAAPPNARSTTGSVFTTMCARTRRWKAERLAKPIGADGEKPREGPVSTTTGAGGANGALDNPALQAKTPFDEGGKSTGVHLKSALTLSHKPGPPQVDTSGLNSQGLTRRQKQIGLLIYF